MTQKRILRANAKNPVRERGLRLRDAFRLAGVDLDDPAAAALISELADEAPEETALAVFSMATRLVDEVVAQTGESRETILARVTL